MEPNDSQLGGTEPEPGFPPTVRDDLARLRTVMANERTLLAYVRTAMMFIGSGATLWKLLGNDAVTISVSVLLLVLGGAMLVLGFARFQTLSDAIG